MEFSEHERSDSVLTADQSGNALLRSSKCPHTDCGFIRSALAHGLAYQGHSVGGYYGKAIIAQYGP